MLTSLIELPQKVISDLLSVYLSHPLENGSVLQYMRFTEISFESLQHSESSGKFLTEVVGYVLEAVKDKQATKIRLYLQILCNALHSTNFHDRAQIWPTVIRNNFLFRNNFLPF
jgi:hypothetical protein